MKYFIPAALSVLAVCAFSAPAQAQRISKISDKNLGAMCSQKKTISLCDAYIAGMADSEVWAHDYAALKHDSAPVAFCIPPQQTTAQIRNIVVAWLGAHQEALSEPAGRGVYRALHDNYPCGIKTGSNTESGMMDPHMRQSLQMAPEESSGTAEKQK